MRIGSVPTRRLANIALGPYMPTPGTAGVFLETSGSFPTELAAYRPYAAWGGAGLTYQLGAAILFYSNDYNVALTYNQVIYWWAGMGQNPVTHNNDLLLGYTMVPDAALSTTPQVFLLHTFTVAPAVNPNGLFTHSDTLINQKYQYVDQAYDDSLGCGTHILANNLGQVVLVLTSDLYLDSSRITVGGGVASFVEPGYNQGVNAVGNFPEITISAASNSGIAPGPLEPFNANTMSPAAVRDTGGPRE